MPFYQRKRIPVEETIAEESNAFPVSQCVVMPVDMTESDPVLQQLAETERLLQERGKAEQVIQERGEVYGPFDVNMYGTALQISGALAQFYGRTDLPPLPAYMAAVIASIFKLNRIVKSPSHEDSHLDNKNYLDEAKKLGSQE